MNDRFKFKVWDKENKRFLSDLSFDITYNGTLILSCGIEGKKYINLNDDNRYILMQCTGLKDKNSALIYEGDIVKDDHDAWHYVKWVYDSWQLFPCTQNNYTIGIVDDEIEVIGNIYQHKELLDERKTIS